MTKGRKFSTKKKYLNSVPFKNFSCAIFDFVVKQSVFRRQFQPVAVTKGSTFIQRTFIISGKLFLTKWILSEFKTLTNGRCSKVYQYSILFLFACKKSFNDKDLTDWIGKQFAEAGAKFSFYLFFLTF